MKNIAIVCAPQRIEKLFLERVWPHKTVNCGEIDCLILLDSNQKTFHERKSIEKNSRDSRFYLLSYQEEFFEEIQSYREVIFPNGLLIILYCLAIKDKKGQWLLNTIWQKQEIEIFLNLLPDFLKWIFLFSNRPSAN